MHWHVCVTVAALFDCLFPSEVHSFAVTQFAILIFLGTLAQLSLLGLNPSSLNVYSMSK